MRIYTHSAALQPGSERARILPAEADPAATGAAKLQPLAVLFVSCILVLTERTP
jgi:hypothetical protein